MVSRKRKRLCVSKTTLLQKDVKRSLVTTHIACKPQLTKDKITLLLILRVNCIFTYLQSLGEFVSKLHTIIQGIY